MDSNIPSIPNAVASSDAWDMFLEMWIDDDAPVLSAAHELDGGHLAACQHEIDDLMMHAQRTAPASGNNISGTPPFNFNAAPHISEPPSGEQFTADLSLSNDRLTATPTYLPANLPSFTMATTAHMGGQQAFQMVPVPPMDRCTAAEPYTTASTSPQLGLPSSSRASFTAVAGLAGCTGVQRSLSNKPAYGLASFPGVAAPLPESTGAFQSSLGYAPTSGIPWLSGMTVPPVGGLVGSTDAFLSLLSNTPASSVPSLSGAALPVQGASAGSTKGSQSSRSDSPASSLPSFPGAVPGVGGLTVSKPALAAATANASIQRAPKKTTRAKVVSTKTRRRAEINSLEAEVGKLIKQMESLQAENRKLKHRERFLKTFTEAQRTVSMKLNPSEPSTTNPDSDKAEKFDRVGVLGPNSGSLSSVPGFLSSLEQVAKALDAAIQVAESAAPLSLLSSFQEQWQKLLLTAMNPDAARTYEGPTAGGGLDTEKSLRNATVRSLLMESSSSAPDKIQELLGVVRQVMKALHTMMLETTSVMMADESNPMTDSTLKQVMDIAENVLMEKVFTLAAKHPLLFFSIFSYNMDAHKIMDPTLEFWEHIARQLECTESQVLDILAAEQHLQHACGELRAHQHVLLTDLLNLTQTSSFTMNALCRPSEPPSYPAASSSQPAPPWASVSAQSQSTSMPTPPTRQSPSQSEGVIPTMPANHLQLPEFAGPIPAAPAQLRQPSDKHAATGSIDGSSHPDHTGSHRQHTTPTNSAIYVSAATAAQGPGLRSTYFDIQANGSVLVGPSSGHPAVDQDITPVTVAAAAERTAREEDIVLVSKVEGYRAVGDGIFPMSAAGQHRRTEEDNSLSRCAALTPGSVEDAAAQPSNMRAASPDKRGRADLHVAVNTDRGEGIPEGNDVRVQHNDMVPATAIDSVSDEKPEEDICKYTKSIQRLERLIRAEGNVALSTWHFFKRAFTPRQRMEIGIKAYPYLPDPLSLMAAMSSLYKKNSLRLRRNK